MYADSPNSILRPNVAANIKLGQQPGRPPPKRNEIRPAARNFFVSTTVASAAATGKETQEAVAIAGTRSNPLPTAIFCINQPSE